MVHYSSVMFRESIWIFSGVREIAGSSSNVGFLAPYLLLIQEQPEGGFLNQHCLLLITSSSLLPLVVIWLPSVEFHGPLSCI